MVLCVYPPFCDDVRRHNASLEMKWHEQHGHYYVVFGYHIRVAWTHTPWHRSQTDKQTVCALRMHWMKEWLVSQTRWGGPMGDWMMLFRTVLNLRLADYLFWEFPFNIFRLQMAAGNWNMYYKTISGLGYVINNKIIKWATASWNTTTMGILFRWPWH